MQEVYSNEANQRTDLAQLQNTDEFQKNKLMWQEYFENRLKTWEPKKSLTNSVLEFTQQCVSSGASQCLIQTESKGDVTGLVYAIQHYCIHTQRPIFYVNYSEDLQCAQDYMHRNSDNTGYLHPGPGGPLYEFMQKYPNGVILINYSHFEASDFVRFNTLVDKVRQIEGVHVPPETQIIGVMEKNPKGEPGEDFFSRFGLSSLAYFGLIRTPKTVPFEH